MSYVGTGPRVHLLRYITEYKQQLSRKWQNVKKLLPDINNKGGAVVNEFTFVAIRIKEIGN